MRGPYVPRLTSSGYHLYPGKNFRARTEAGMSLAHHVAAVKWLLGRLGATEVQRLIDLLAPKADEQQPEQQRSRRRRRFYSQAEIDQVRVLYGTMPAATLAARLHRTVASLYQLADRLHLTTPNRFPPEKIAHLRALHAAGLPDRLIATKSGIDRRTVGDIRNRLGLPLIPDIEGKRNAVRNQLKTLGLTSPTQLRTRDFRLYAQRYGWPEDFRPREVQICEALRRRGPMTRKELVAALGMRWRGVHNSLSGNGPGGSYLATLMRRGVVVCLGRVVRTGRKGGNLCLYSLTLDAEARHGQVRAG